MATSALSYLKTGDEEEWIPDGPNFTYVDKWASVYPDKEAFVFRPSETEREVISYKDLRTSTENLAVWFKRTYDVKKGDRVGILSLNRLAYLLAEVALARLGAVSVRVYATMDSRKDLTRSLTIAQCRLFLCQKASLSSCADIVDLESHDARKRLVSADLPDLQHVICLTGEESPGTVPFPDWRPMTVTEQELDDLHRIQRSVTLDDDASIYSTSGSTGEPKFVVHSHLAALSFAAQIIRRLGYRETDRYFSDRPLAHIGGNVNGPLQFGGTSIVANAWKTVSEGSSEYLATIFREEGVTCGISLSYILYDLAKGADIELNNSRFFLFGGQLASAEIIKLIQEWLKPPLSAAYGSTEMCEISCTGIQDSLEVIQNYVGKPVPGVEVKVVDPKTREILPRGEIGTIGIKCRHKWYYLNNPEKMSETHDEDGFFYQGDLARISQDGYLQILGRDDDMMSIGTVKIYPASVEHKICQHPCVDKAIVFGVPDERLFEVIGAAVQPKPGVTITSQEIIQFFHECVHEGDLMTGLEYGPKYVWIETSFPMTKSGKIDKKTLKSNCLNSLDRADTQ